MSTNEIYAKIFKIPVEIMDFACETFELYEIRGRVGSESGIKFEVRSKEGNHTIPHVHAAFGGYQISISIMDANVLAGNLPRRQQRKAQEWVGKNREKLLNQWCNIHIDKEIPFMRSGLNLGE